MPVLASNAAIAQMHKIGLAVSVTLKRIHIADRLHRNTRFLFGQNFRRVLRDNMYLQIAGTKASIRSLASARIYVLSAIGQWSDKLVGAKRFDAGY